MKIINQSEKVKRHTKSSGNEEVAETKVVAVAQNENFVNFASSIVLRDLRIVRNF